MNVEPKLGSRGIKAGRPGGEDAHPSMGLYGVGAGFGSGGVQGYPPS